MDEQACFTEDFFTYWSNLAKDDPERFERERKEAIEKVITAAPERIQRRLIGLQWQIDIERARAGDPLSGAVRLYKMMADYAFFGKELPHMGSLFQEVGVELSHLESDLSSLAK